MKTVRLNKSEVLETLKSNRDKHRSIFEDALGGYRARCLDILDERIKMIKEGKKFNMHILLEEPFDATPFYDTVIKMMEMSVDKVVELQHEAFKNYVMDEWDWKGQFVTSNSDYTEML